MLNRIFITLMACWLAIFPAGAQALAVPITPIGKIEKAQLGKYITVMGTLKEAGNFSVGFKFVLQDDTGKIDVTLFEKTYDTLPKREQMQVGAVVQINGKLDEYNGAYEIVPSKGKDALVITPTLRSVLTRTLGSLNNGDHGAIINISGEVYSIEPFDKGNDVIVTDGTGTQKVRLWQVVSKRVSPDVLKKGTKIRLVGKVRVIRGKGLQIEPALPIDVVVTK